MANKFKHTHQYRKLKLGKRTIFKCVMMGCAHYVYKELAEGRVSLCNRCGIPFMLDKPAMTLAFPHCRECTVSKKKEQIDRIKELLIANEK